MSDKKKDVQLNLDKDSEGRVIEKRPLVPIENLVFEGGGVKGLVYVGALRVLNDNGDLKGVERVGGSSAGGITAMLVGLGYTVSEVEQEMSKMDFTKFQDSGNTFWENVPKELGKLQGGIKKVEEAIKVVHNKKHGIYKGDVFLEWARAKIAEKLGNPDATFADLQKARNVDPKLKDMMFTGSNITGNGPRLQYFNAETTPNVRIADAVRATMSFPGAFEAYEIVVNGTKSTFVDGGLANNFPMKYYDQFGSEDRNSNPEGINTRTLGLRVDNREEIENYKWKLRDKEGRDISSIKDFAIALSAVKLSDREEVNLRGVQIVQIPDCGVKTLNFGLTDSEKEALIDSGADSTIDYLLMYRIGTYAGYKKHENMREYYRSKNIEDLVVDRNNLDKELADLQATFPKGTAREPTEKELDIKHRRAIVNEILEAYKKTKEEELLDNISKHIAINLQYANLNNDKLNAVIKESSAFQKELQELLAKINLFEAAMQDEGVLKSLNSVFARIKNLSDELNKRSIELDKMKDRKNYRGEKLPERAREDAENSLKKFKKEEMAKINMQLKRGLDNAGYPELITFVSAEIAESLKSPHPKSLAEYHKHLISNKGKLDKKLYEVQDLNYQCKKQQGINDRYLKKIEFERQAFGRDPGKMLEFSNTLENFIKSQKSSWDIVRKGLRGLAAFVATGGLYFLAPVMQNTACFIP